MTSYVTNQEAVGEDGSEHVYKMTVDLSVLESLGINLYSNAAAVLSELVANAYDADSTLVTIDWKQDGERVIVKDDGVGMTVDELNDRFLKVGYKKRLKEGFESEKWNRPFMGRKGIGKLSVFSIAKVVSVYSTSEGGSSNGLKIDVDALEAAIQNEDFYYPDPIEVPAEYQERGTTIVLDSLKSKRADLTAAALRKRLARRFDVMDQTPREQGGFFIEVNGENIDWNDREELRKLEFIWEFGEKRLSDDVLPKGVGRFVLENDVVNKEHDWRVRGWIGTAKHPNDLTEDEEAGSLKNIIVLARKRPIQEGIIEKLDFSKLFGNYVTGQIEADFLDLDGEYEDIATSDRQRLIEDDDRVVDLRRFLREAFGKAADEWSDARPNKAAKDLLKDHPKLREWVEERPPWQHDAAETMIGTIASLELEKEAEKGRADLLRSGVLAFERVGLRKASADLEQLASVSATDLLPLLGAQDAYEAGLWLDILKSRVEAISQFRNLTQEDEKEKVLQRHLFNHLWLLDAAWERAAVGGSMEKDLRRLYPGLFAKDPEGNELLGRLDIHYATAGGRHVIVELKKYSVKPKIGDLMEQGSKYHEALKSLLEQQGKVNPDIDVIFVLGNRPKAGVYTGNLSEEDYIRDELRRINGSVALYDELIANAEHQYQDYLEASDKARELDELLTTLTEQ